MVLRVGCSGDVDLLIGKEFCVGFGVEFGGGEFVVDVYLELGGTGTSIKACHFGQIWRTVGEGTLKPRCKEFYHQERYYFGR